MEVYFLLTCKKCKWWRKCSGISEELKDLVEIKNCINCGGPRKFKCPKCSTLIKMMRYSK